MKISLVHLPQWNLEQPPLGIAYLTSYLRSRGHEVEQRDLSIELFAALPQDRRSLLETQHHIAWIERETFFGDILPQIKSHVEAWISELAFNSAPVLGFTVLSTSRLLTMHVAERIKQKNPDKVILIGGPQTARYEDGLEIAKLAFVDFVIPDEGEETADELMTALAAGADPRGVKGLLFKEGGQVVDTGERPLLKKLNELPFPCFDGFPLGFYKGLTIPILGSRGCVFSCSFCSETVFWKRYRYRSGENILAEMKHQSEIFRTNGFYIVDSLINGVVRELDSLCDHILKEDFQAYWGGKASILPQMTPELCRKMYAAGCRQIHYGIESGSAKVLKDMSKQFKVPVAEQVLKNSAEAGIEVGAFFLIGFPTETEADFEETLAFLRRNHGHLDCVTPGYGCGIQKGSELHENPAKYGIEFRENGWHSPHSTPEIRERRVRRFIEECRLLNLAVSY